MTTPQLPDPSWWEAFFKGYVLADAIYVLALIVVVHCLWRGQRQRHINLWDIVTSTDRQGLTLTDGRKLFEVGVFVVMTVGFSYLLLIGKMSEFYAGIYVGSFIGARALRDREQRLNKQLGLTGGEKGGDTPTKP